MFVENSLKLMKFKIKILFYGIIFVEVGMEIRGEIFWYKFLGVYVLLFKVWILEFIIWGYWFFLELGGNRIEIDV